MKIIKKINNNIALAINAKDEEVIVIGKGIGFPKTPYELRDESIIEKIFVTQSNNDYLEMFKDIPLEDIYLTQEIIKYGEEYLGKKLNTNILLTLSDHISYAIQRFNQGVEVKSPLEWEIKHLYPDEFKIGVKAIEIIRNERGIRLTEPESVFIALHFINAQIGDNKIDQTAKITEIIGDILGIVKYHFRIELDESSINFTRFVKHLQYFIYRQLNKSSLEGENENLYKIVEKQYTNENECVHKIEEFLKSNYGWNCSIDEKLYLVLHIQRVTSRVTK
ncbi:PRD domain-containing protein [Clostridium sp. NSJ-6]|uniref:PRD domain-containing protein n=1 Tax=Clostridium hominis TaxID=2763036 RepID=A0ABR7DDD7_9CLOT|nr:PRD domain-containing protein [Clostridium hominis]MBC5629424.1 PRD domain-containing protein [Clostridium hominis]MDU2671322.1 PRD domain-containing protein [Clostridium sp.]